MGPLHMQLHLSIGLPGPIIIMGPAADALGWAHFNAQMQLPMGSLWPIVFLGAAANALGWAYCNSQVQLLIGLPGPVIFLGVAANVLEWAHRIRSCSCRWLHLGQSCFWQALPMCYDGLIICAAKAAKLWSCMCHCMRDRTHWLMGQSRVLSKLLKQRH